MATSTTLKLPEELKKRIAPLAKAAGKTPHAWMVEALESKVALDEKRRSFIQDALDARAEVERTGVTYRAADVHRWLSDRIAGKPSRKPSPVRRPR